jgi:shikimate kinase
MKMRDPLYREVADIIVDTNRRNPRSVSVDISKRIAAMSEEQVALKAKAEKAKAEKAKES